MNLNTILGIISLVMIVSGSMVVFKGEWMKKTITTLTDSNTALDAQNKIFEGQIKDLTTKIAQAHQEIAALQRIATGVDAIDRLHEAINSSNSARHKEHMQVLSVLERISGKVA